MKPKRMILIAAIAAAAVLLIAFSGDEAPPGPAAPDDTSPRAILEPPAATRGDDPAAPGKDQGTPTASGRIHGVVRENGVPVAAAMTLRSITPTNGDFMETWLADPADGSVVAVGTADAEGRYHFPGVGPGSYEIEARFGDESVGFAAAHLSPGFDRQRVNVDLAAGGHVVSGLARFADGRPWLGRVGVVAADDGMQFYGTFGRPAAMTDELGRFEIRGVPAGRYQLCAGPAGNFRGYSRTVAVPRSGEVLFVLDEGLRTVPGRVVDSTTGDPLGGVKVIASGHHDDGRYAISRLVTGADGRFQARIPGSFLHIMAFRTGFRRHHEHFEAPAGPVEVRMPPDGRISGRVLSAGTGEPVAGALVRWRPGWSAGVGGSGAVFSNAEGRYELTDVPAVEVHLYVRGGGWISELLTAEKRHLDPFAVPPRGGVERDLFVVAAGRALVQVRDMEGSPVSRAVVTAEHDGRWFTNTALGEDEEEDLTAVTGRDGSVILDGLRPGVPYDLTARADDGPRGVVRRVKAFARQQVDLEVRIPRARWIEVLVTEAGTGRPVRGAVLTIGPLEDEWTTDLAGRALAGPFGDRDMQFSVRHPDYLRPEDRLKVPRGIRSVETELTRGLVVTGTVRFPGGEPGAGAGITACESAGGRSLAGATADEEGRFEFTALPELYVDLEAVNHRDEVRFAAKARVKAGRRGVTLELVPTPRRDEREDDRSVVRVVGPDGHPVPRASARLFRIAFEKVRPGRGHVREGVLRVENPRWIEIHAARDARNVPLPFGAALVGPIDEWSGELVIRLPEQRSIEGRLESVDGSPVPEVRIRAVPKYPEFPLPLSLEPDEHDEAKTEADGRFRLVGLSDRTYRLVAELPGRYAERSLPTVRAGERGVTIKLRAAARTLLTVLDTDGKPLVGAQLEARSPTRSWRSTALTDTGGRARLAGLDSSRTYDLVISPPEGREDVVPLPLPGWRPGEETFSLPQPLTISGTATRPDGEPVHTDVFYRGVLDEHPRSVSTYADGKFEIPGLSPGTWRLSTSRNDPEVPVQAGTTDVVLIRAE
jgi:hypothetical protein